MPPIAFQSSDAFTPARALRSSADVPAAARRTTLGLVTYCFNLAAKHSGKVDSALNFSDPHVFIREAARIGATAVQIPFPASLRPSIGAIRDLADRSGIALETTLSLPKNAGDRDRFVEELKLARELGVRIARTVLLPGRRYEQFKSISEYRDMTRRATEALAEAEKIARRHGIKLALENHKDQTTEERLALLEHFSSEHIGACLDVGNNLALLEDPIAVARAFAPWTLSVHFKDQGLREYEEGFLLADVPVGEGAMDLAGITQIIREKKPDVLFHLELITRDPLKIPYLRDDYWATLDAVKASQLGATLALVKGRSAAKPFPLVSTLAPAEQVRVERQNIEQSLRFAAGHLGFIK